MTNSNKIGAVILSILSFILVTCNDDEVTPREYPRVKTLAVNHITALGATFNAKIISPGNGDIIEYGFVWGETENPTIDFSEKKVLARDMTMAGFTAEISTTLKEGVNYYVRAYAKNDEYLVYGKNVSFLSLGSKGPKVEDFYPKEGTFGDTITIVGKHFSFVKENNKVYFGSDLSNTIVSTDSTIITTVPFPLNTVASNINIEIAGNKSENSDEFMLLPMVVNSVFPSRGKYGDTLTIDGENFGNIPNHAKVFFKDIRAEVIKHLRNSLTVVVPEITASDTMNITIEVGQFSEAISFVSLTPKIIDFIPKNITWGDTVKVKVQNFTDDKQKLVLKLVDGYNSYRELKINILKVNDSEVEFIVPNDYSYLNSHIRFETAGITLTTDNKLILREPQIRGITEIVQAGQELMITGENFHPFRNHLLLNNYSIPSSESSSGEVKFILPEGEFYYQNRDSNNKIKIILRSFNIIVTSATIFVKAPIINHIEQLSDSFDDVIKITGEDLGGNPTVTITQGELIYDKYLTTEKPDFTADIIDFNDNEILFKVPKAIINESDVSQVFNFKFKVNSYELSALSDPILSLKHTGKWTFYDDQEPYKSRIRNTSQTLKLGDNGYLLAGIKYENTYQYLNELWQFNFTSKEWRRLADWPKVNSASERVSVSFLYDGAIHIITSHGAVFQYDLLSDRWSQIGSFPPYNYLDFFEVNGQGYLANATYIYKFDLNYTQWLPIASIPRHIYSWLQAYVYNNKVRFVYADGKQNEYDVVNNTFKENVIVGSGEHIKIYKNGGSFYTIDDMNLYAYDPSNDAKSFVTDYPDIISGNVEYLFTGNNVSYFLFESQSMGGFQL